MYTLSFTAYLSFTLSQFFFLQHFPLPFSLFSVFSVCLCSSRSLCWSELYSSSYSSIESTLFSISNSPETWEHWSGHCYCSLLGEFKSRGCEMERNAFLPDWWLFPSLCGCKCLSEATSWLLVAFASVPWGEIWAFPHCFYFACFLHMYNSFIRYLHCFIPGFPQMLKKILKCLQCLHVKIRP